MELPRVDSPKSPGTWSYWPRKDGTGDRVVFVCPRCGTAEEVDPETIDDDGVLVFGMKCRWPFCEFETYARLEQYP